MSELTLVIGDKNWSSWSLRPWLALKMAGATFREEKIRLRQPDTKANILAHSPSGKVPLLKDGDLLIWESLAICEYVADLFPAARLWPQDQTARAVARAVASEMHASFVELRKNMPMDMANAYPGQGLTPEVAADIARIEAIWADCRARFGKPSQQGPFLFGAFSVADAMFAPVASRFSTYAPPLSAEARAYMDAIWSLNPMQEWRKDALAESGKQ